MQRLMALDVYKNAKTAYDAGVLQAQNVEEGVACRYVDDDNGGCRCAIGVSLSDETLAKIANWGNTIAIDSEVLARAAWVLYAISNKISQFDGYSQQVRETLRRFSKNSYLQTTQIG